MTRPAAGDPVMNYEAAHARLAGRGGRGDGLLPADDWGADELWGDNVPAVGELRTVEEEQDWQARPSAAAVTFLVGVALLAAFAIFMVGFRLGELHAQGWFR